jgi:hypothetical protein
MRNYATSSPPQANKVNKTCGYLNNAIWNNKNLRQEPKFSIYKSSVRPLMIYAAETGPDNSKRKQVMKTTETRTLRKMVAKTRFDIIRKQDIR